MRGKTNWGLLVKMGYILSILVVGCIFLHKTVVIRKNQESNILSEFIIGRWVGEFSESGNGVSYNAKFQVEIIDRANLVFWKKTPYNEMHNVLFPYEFIEEHTIKINSRLTDEWEVYRDGENLKILASSGIIGNGIYIRRPVIDWPLLAVSIGMMLIGLIFIDVPRLNHKREEINFWGNKVEGEATPLRRIIKITIHILFFCMGIIMILPILASTQIQSIRLPWDAVIILEIGATLIILGFKSVKFGYRVVKLQHTIPTIYLFLVRSLLLGGGSVCLIIGIFKLAVFLIFDGYPYG